MRLNQILIEVEGNKLDNAGKAAKELPEITCSGSGTPLVFLKMTSADISVYHPEDKSKKMPSFFLTPVKEAENISIENARYLQIRRGDKGYNWIEFMTENYHFVLRD